MAQIGGGGQVDIFYINAEHTKITTTAGGSTEITDVNNRAIRIGRDYAKNNILIQSDFSIDEDGKLSITWNQTKFDAVWDTFIKSVVGRKQGGASTETEELVDERGIKVGGAAAASSQDVLIVSYGALNDDTKIPVIFAVGNISKTSNGFSFQANTFVKPSLSFTSKGCLNDSDLTITSALDIYDATTNAGGLLGTVSPDVKLEKDELYGVAFLNPKT